LKQFQLEEETKFQFLEPVGVFWRFFLKKKLEFFGNLTEGMTCRCEPVIRR